MIDIFCIIIIMPHYKIISTYWIIMKFNLYIVIHYSTQKLQLGSGYHVA